MANDLEVMLKVREQGIETFDRATNALKGLFAAYISIAGARRFISFSIDAAHAADDEEKSNRKLINALKEKNLYTEQSFAFYKEFAKEQMMIVGKSHEEIESVQTLLLQYGVYGPLVNKTTKAIMDLAAAKGMDLTAATAVVLRGLESETGSLGKLGLTANGTAGSVERLSSIYDVLTRTFKGSAEAGASELDKIQLKWDELKEDFGKKVLPIVIKVGNTTVGFWDTLEQALKSTKEALTEGGQIKPSTKGFEVQLRYSEKMLKDAQERLTKSQGLKGDASLFEKLYIGTPESAQKAIEVWSGKIEEWKNKIEVSQKAETITTPTLAGGITDRPLDDDALKKIADSKKKALEQDKKLHDEATKWELSAWNEETKRMQEENRQYWENYDYKEQLAENHRKKMREIAKAQLDEQKELAMQLGAAIGAGVGQGAQGLKITAKAVMTTLLDVLEKKIMAGWISAALDNVFFPGLGVPSLLKMTAITASFAAVKAGINSFAAGTSYAPGGWSMVGERGSELMNVPRGSQIYNNQQTRNMVTNNKPSITLNVYGGDGNLQSQLERGVRSKEIDLPRLLETAGVRL